MIDAADTPERLSRLLDSIRETGPRRIILVFGCEGERDKMIRPFMGEIAHWKVCTLVRLLADGSAAVLSGVATMKNLGRTSKICGGEVNCAIGGNHFWSPNTANSGAKARLPGLQADIVILTNSNPRGERPSNIIADIVAGYPDDLLEHNAMQPYQPGFLQDPAYIPFEALEFSWHNNYE